VICGAAQQSSLVLPLALWQKPLVVRLFVYIFLAVAALGVGFDVRSQPRGIIVGVEDLDYPPHYTTLSGTYRGFGREFFDSFAAAEGLTVEYRPLPVVRLHQALLEGRITFKYPDHPSWQPEPKQAAGVTYSQPVVGYIDGIMVKPERLKQPAEPLHTLAMVRGFSLPAATPWQLQPPALIELTSLGASIRETLLGQAEGLFGNVEVLKHQMRYIMMLPDETLVFDQRLPHQRGSYYVSTRDNKDLLQRLDQWMQRETAMLSALKQRYGLPD